MTLALVPLALLALSEIHAVPGDFATIQAAVDAAAPGDVVEIGPGTWFEQVTVTTASLTLRASAGARGTAIDGSGAGRPLTVTADDFVLEDLTLQHGASEIGGGLWLEGDGARLTRARLLNNDSFAVWRMGIGGGGAFVVGDDLRVEATTFQGNLAGPESFGAGLFVAGDRVDLRDSEFVGNIGEISTGCGAALLGDEHSVQDCLFDGNVGDYCSGMGLFVDGLASSIVRCTFQLHSGLDSSACLLLHGANHRVEDVGFFDTVVEYSGAIECPAEACRFERVLVVNNVEGPISVRGSCQLRDVEVRGYHSNYGDAAIMVSGSSGGSAERVLIQTGAGGGGGGYAFGVRLIGTEFTLRDVLIAQSNLHAGVTSSNSIVKLENVAIADCWSSSGAGFGTALEILGVGGTTVSNSVFWNPQCASETLVDPLSPRPTFDHCFIRGVAPDPDAAFSTLSAGEGIDPLFLGGSDDPWIAYRPAPGSPLIDAGRPQTMGLRLDLAHGARRIDGDFDGFGIVDIGPFEYTESHLLDVSTEPDSVRLRVEGPANGFGALVTGRPAAAHPLGVWGSLYFDLGPATQVVAGFRPVPFEVDVPPGAEMLSIAQGLVLDPFSLLGQVTNPLALPATPPR